MRHAPKEGRPKGHHCANCLHACESNAGRLWCLLNGPILNRPTTLASSCAHFDITPSLAVILRGASPLEDTDDPLERRRLQYARRKRSNTLDIES